MRYHKYRKIAGLLVCVICILGAINVWASDLQSAPSADDLLDQAQEQIDYEEMEEAADELLDEENGSGLSFRELVDGLISGEYGFNMQTFKTLLAGQTTGRIASMKNQLLQLLMLGLFSAVFTVIASALGSKQVSEIGFYVALLLLTALVLHTFFAASAVVSSMIERLLSYVKLMMPAYMLIVAAAGGATTAVIFYEGFLFLVFAVDWLVVRILIPLVHMYVIMGIVNHISEEDLFSRFADLVRQLVKWALKAILGLVVGFQLIQGLLTPFVDSFKTSALQKTLAALPGIGNLMNGVTELAFGAGILIKNGIGTAMLLLILIACLLPVVSTGAYTFLFQTAGALLQPVADKRIVKCLSCAREGTALLLRILLTTVFLFLLTIAVLTATTNLGH